MRTYLSVFLFFVCASFLGNAQNKEVVPDLTGSEFNKKVVLTWTINQGNTCNGIDVYRSVDSVNFTKIGNIEGICGSPESSTSYQFTDNFPEKNEINYYRLKLGALGYTYIVQVEVLDIGESNYLIRPNPISENTLLIFNNDTNSEVRLIVHDFKGSEVYTALTIGEEFVLSKNDFIAGVYFFTLKTNQRNVTGRFVVN